MLDYEKKYSNKYTLIGGIDEAGRGPLAGPVVCACVIMKEGYFNDQIDDSKKLSPKLRESLFNAIIENCVCYGISVIDNNVIDDINILNATKMGMIEAFKSMPQKPEILLIDAVKLDVPIKNEAIIGGDGKSFNIAAASILAKVTRDRIMQEYDKQYPDYLFSKHKGYPTKEHIRIIRELGATKIHRKTYLKNIMYEQCDIWQKR